MSTLELNDVNPTTTYKTRSGAVVIGKVFTTFRTRCNNLPVKTSDLESKLFAPHKLIPLLVSELMLDFDQASELVQQAVNHFKDKKI